MVHYRPYPYYLILIENAKINMNLEVRNDLVSGLEAKQNLRLNLFVKELPGMKLFTVSTVLKKRTSIAGRSRCKPSDFVLRKAILILFTQKSRIH